MEILILHVYATEADVGKGGGLENELRQPSRAGDGSLLARGSNQSESIHFCVYAVLRGIVYHQHNVLRIGGNEIVNLVVVGSFYVEQGRVTYEILYRDQSVFGDD